jgi:hypothetical protein
MPHKQKLNFADLHTKAASGSLMAGCIYPTDPCLQGASRTQAVQRLEPLAADAKKPASFDEKRGKAYK